MYVAHLQDVLVIAVPKCDVAQFYIKPARRWREVRCPWTVLSSNCWQSWATANSGKSSRVHCHGHQLSTGMHRP